MSYNWHSRLIKKNYLDKERHSIHRKIKSDNRDTFPTRETHFWWRRSFAVKFSDFISRARSWRMVTVMFLKRPTHGYCHSARRALPGVAESICFKAVSILLPQGEGARQGGWGIWQCRVVNPSPTVCDGHPSPNRRGVSSLILDSATSPFGFAQNDKSGFSYDRDYYLLKVKYSFWRSIKSDNEGSYKKTVTFILWWRVMKNN